MAQAWQERLVVGRSVRYGLDNDTHVEWEDYDWWRASQGVELVIDTFAVDNALLLHNADGRKATETQAHETLSRGDWTACYV